jgi:hypothetical protein
MKEPENLEAFLLVDVFSAVYIQCRVYLIVTVMNVIRKLFQCLVAIPYLGYIFYHEDGRNGSVSDVIRKTYFLNSTVLIDFKVFNSKLLNLY